LPVYGDQPPIAYTLLKDDRGAQFALHFLGTVGVIAKGTQLKSLNDDTKSVFFGDIELIDDKYSREGVPKGTIWSLTAAEHKGIVNNLAKISVEQKEALEKVLGKHYVLSAQDATTAIKLPSPTTSGDPTSTAAPEDGEGLTDKPWFWPVSIAAGVLVVGGIAYYFTRPSAEPVEAATNRRRRRRRK
jgi:hypothetical protein